MSTHDSQPVITDNSYVLEKIDLTCRDKRIVGVFPAYGLADMARDNLVSLQSEEELDAGIFFRITTFETGKLYP